MALASACVALALDGDDERDFRRRAFDRRGRFSIHSLETQLPDSLPRTPRIYSHALARRTEWRVPNGIGARHVLHRLLLGTHGSPFRRRRNEHSLGSRTNAARLPRKNIAGSRSREFRHWERPRRLGRIYSRDPLFLFGDVLTNPGSFDRVARKDRLET